VSAAKKKPDAPVDRDEGYREIFENAPIGVYRSTPDGRVLMANPALARMFGYSSFEDMSGMNLQKSGYHPDTPREMFVAAIEKTGVVTGYESVFVRKDGSHMPIRENAKAVKDDKGNTIYYEGTVEDISEKKKADELLARRAEMEKIITRIATRFVNLAPDEVDLGIEKALRELGEFLAVDRSYVFLFSADGKRMSNTHEWAADGVEPVMDDLQDLETASFSWCVSKMVDKEVLVVPSVEDLPPEAEAEKLEWQSEEIQSLIMVPLVCGANTRGFMGYDAVWEEREWDDSTVAVTSVVGEIFASALERRRVEEEIRYRAEFDELITSISARFVNIKPSEVDDTITEALREFGEFADVDRSYVYVLSRDGKTMTRTHFWCAEGVETEPVAVVDTGVLGIPWGLETLRKGEVLHIPSVANMPKKAKRDSEYLAAQDIKSLIAVPFTHPDGRMGFIGFSSAYAEVSWPDDIVAHLKLVGEMFVNAMARRLTSLALEKERLLVTALGANTPDHIYFKDLKSRFIWANQSLATTFGLSSPDEVVGKTDRDFFTGEHAEEALADEQRVIRTGKPIIAKEEKETWPDGSETWVSTAKMPLRNAQGEIVGTFGISRDITQRKREEVDRRKIEEKMQHTQKLESLGVLSGGIAHDFNNLLMGILGNTGLALMDLPPESRVHSIVQQIETAALRAAELTNQMLAYSGKSKFVIKPLNLTTLVKEMAHLLAVSISKKINITYDFDETVPLIDADATQLRQVVMNLITNASDAMGKEGGAITVRTGTADCDENYMATCYVSEGLAEGKYVFTEVTDTGCGMTTDTLEKIFDPFFTTKVKGRGLGLAAVLGIVRGHKGALRVYSELDKGTTFKVLFPCSKAKPDAVVQPPEVVELHGSGIVLVVDDEPIVRTVTTGMLEKFGYTVEIAGDGSMALKKFKKIADAATAVLLDVTMPEMSTDAILDGLRKIRKDVPVILISGYSEESALVDIRPRDYNGFLQKPYNAQMLARKLLDATQGK